MENFKYKGKLYSFRLVEKTNSCNGCVFETIGCIGARIRGEIPQCISGKGCDKIYCIYINFKTKRA